MKPTARSQGFFRHTRWGARRGSTRTIGLAASALTALAAIALVGFFYLRGRAGAPVIARGNSVPSEKAPDILSGVPGQGLGAGKGMEITLMDRDDPRRVSMRIKTDSSEPQPNARYQVRKPEAFLYSRNGTITHIRADTGLLYVPNTQGQPEAATLEGNVVVRTFDEPAPGSKFDPDAPGIEPLMTFRAPAIQYDGTLGEVATSTAFDVTTPQAIFNGNGLRVIFNQESRRLEYCEVPGGGSLEYSTDGTDPLTKKRRENRKPATPPAPGTPAPAPKDPPVETYYHAVLGGGVRVTRGSQEIDSDALDSWVHLVDNELPDDAVTPAPVRIAANTNEPKATPPPDADVAENAPTAPEGTQSIEPTETPAEPATKLAQSDTPTPPSEPPAKADDKIVIRWPGSMVIRVAETKPQELAKDKVAVRFTTGPDALCNFKDPAAGARGTASQIDYGATSQVLTLAAIRPDGVVLTADGSGTATCASLSINLGSGQTTINGAGTLRDGADRYITWAGRAQFQFATGPEGMSSMVESASASGAVEAIQGSARLRGSELAASFLVSENRSDVYKLQVSGKAQAADGKGGELNADALNVSFADASAKGTPLPEMIDATGNVLGQKDGTSLSAQTLHVNLTADEESLPVATSINAAGDVKFVKVEEKSDGRINVINASADEIAGDIEAQMVELIGPNSSIGNLTSRVVGSTIRVDGMRRYVDVYGQGRFEHQGGAVDSAGTSDALVTWTRHVAYDDVMGIVECEGNVVASNHPDAFTVQTMRADRVKLMLEPHPEGVPLNPDSPPRRLQQAYAWGIPGEAPRPAQLEMRVYDTPGAVGRERPVRVAFLEGNAIAADDDAGTLNVPGAGRMYFSDRRQRAQDVKSEARLTADDAMQTSNPFGGKSRRGDARFIWNDSMDIDRRMGLITIKGKSNLRHVRLVDGLPTDIEADTLIGKFRNIQVSQADRDNSDIQAEFLGADAMGNVWIRSTDNKELVADRVEYDAEAGIAKASANEGNSVVFFDPTQAVPQRARLLYLDLTNNRVEIKDAGTVVVPR
ncbi:MAG: LPS export ABC transporter periplasmic protein LptC [Phycisphaerales bacterium]|nr:LPS export ABC transporter periplasmic protein LptC [Phycisphaerales bacterium]